jgi:hypothetical protein
MLAANTRYEALFGGYKFDISKSTGMKQLRFLLSLLMLFLVNSPLSANDKDPFKKKANTAIGVSVAKNTMNFFIISKRKKGKLDLATRFNVLRTKIRMFFQREKFVAVVAKDSRHMSRKLKYWLNKRNADLGTVWFDSHGMYKKGYSLFTIGHDEISYKTLHDSTLAENFSSLSGFTNQQSKFIIGSCYGGATYTRTSIDYKDTTRMNGDSLMFSLGNILKNGQIFGCESWVMSKPGLFWKRPATGGSPGRKLFLDLCYEPAWKNIGKWNEYTIQTNEMRAVNTISLDKHGSMVVRGRTYVDEKKAEKDINKKLLALQPNLYK